MIQISKISLEIWMNMAMNMAVVLQCLHTVSNMCLKNADTAFRFGCKIVLSSLTPSVVPEQETPHSCLDCHTRPQISCQPALCRSHARGLQGGNASQAQRPSQQQIEAE